MRWLCRPGVAAVLQRDMRQLVEDLLTALPAAFQSDEYRRRAQELQDGSKREDEVAGTLGRQAGERGIALVSTPTGYSLAPIKDGKVLGPDEFAALEEEEKSRLQESWKAQGGTAPHARPCPAVEARATSAPARTRCGCHRLTVGQLIVELEARYAIAGGADYLARCAPTWSSMGLCSCPTTAVTGRPPTIRASPATGSI